MRTLSSASVWLAATLAWGTVGCRSNEDRCRELCDWADECGTDNVDCSDQDEIDECVDDIDDSGDDCEDAIDEFLDCIDDNPDCDDVESACRGEALETLDHCSSRSSSTEGPSVPQDR